MKTRNAIQRLMAVILIGALSLSALTAFAQDQTASTATPFIGIRFVPDEAGIRVEAVQPNSPASEAGLEADDVITEVDGEAVDAETFAETVRSHAVGDTLALTVVRGDETLELSVTLGEAPAGGRRNNDQFGEFSYNPETQAWTIGRLSEGSPLYEAGLREGDVITAFNGESYELPALVEVFIGLAEDATVTLTVERGDETLSIDVPAATLQMIAMAPLRGGRFGGPRGGNGDGQPGYPPMNGMPFAGARLGVAFITLNEQVASENSVDVTDGALITEVVEGSPAADAGLQAGDVVTAVDGDTVDAEHTLRDRLIAYEPEDTVTLDVLRDGETLQIQVTLGQPERLDSLPFHLFGEPGTQQPEVTPEATETPAA